MALGKNVATDFGTDAVYWNIGAYQDIYHKQRAVITMYGYASAAAYEAGKSPLTMAQIHLVDDYAPDLTRADLYARVKDLNAWKDATNL